jgi:hypothetical protein
MELTGPSSLHTVGRSPRSLYLEEASREPGGQARRGAGGRAVRNCSPARILHHFCCLSLLGDPTRLLTHRLRERESARALPHTHTLTHPRSSRAPPLALSLPAWRAAAIATSQHVGVRPPSVSEPTLTRTRRPLQHSRIRAPLADGDPIVAGGRTQHLGSVS